MKDTDGEYCSFEKYVYVYEDVECTSTETEEDKYDPYIGFELQLLNKSAIKRMARVWKIFLNADGNPEVTGNYKVWVDHTEYEIGFCDGSTSKPTANIISKKCCLRLIQREGNFSYLRKFWSQVGLACNIK